ncbi:FkbM family methyltransferase [Persephonella sp.]
MDNISKLFYRGFLSKIQIIREIYTQFKDLNSVRYCVTKLRNYDVYLLVNINDEWGYHVLKYGYIEFPEEKFIKKLINRGDTIIDVGAHWGGFSSIFAKLTGKKGKVISFEASSYNYKMLNKNICINYLGNIVQTFNLAVGHSKGKIRLGIANSSSGHNSVLRKDIDIKLFEEVEQISLDEFCEENNVKDVNFIKVDVEGYELEVLKGMKNLLRKSTNLWMFLEYSPSFLGKDRAEELYELLQENFDKVLIGHKKKIFETDWETAKNISFQKGQRNLFLYKK